MTGTRRSSASVLAALLVLALALASRPASAHAPDVSTARVTLRDEHVELIAEWDLFPLLDRSATDLATASEEEVVRSHRALVALLERETTLTVDGARLALTVSGFPTPPELRALAATLSAASHDHGARARIRFEAREPVREARTLALSCPAKVGPVNASFTQPANRYVREGEAASFAILAPSAVGWPSSPAPSPSSAPTPAASRDSMLPILPFLGGLTIGALAVRLLRRPRTTPTSRS